MRGGTMKTAVTLASIVLKNGGVRRCLIDRNCPVSFEAWKGVHSNLPSGVKLIAYDAMPRIVSCVGFPTRQEANETILELVHVLDKFYVSSSNSIGIGENALNHLQNNGSLVRTVPGHVIKVFQLFCISTELQNVVASLASDPNVLKAVFHNEDLQRYITSSKKSGFFNQSAAQCDESSYDGTGYIHKIKTRVFEMMRILSDKFWDVFGENSGTNTGEISAMGLAIMVIMLVYAKRT